jgi:hypothetical protein
MSWGGYGPQSPVGSGDKRIKEALRSHLQAANL